MIGYLDSSVVVRWLFKTADSLRDFTLWRKQVSSALLEVECRRTVERMHLEKEISDEDYATAIDQLEKLKATLDLVEIDQHVLDVAKGQFSVSIKTLDAIHLATAKLLRDEMSEEIMVVSHDAKMNLLAKTLGFKTLESK